GVSSCGKTCSGDGDCPQFYGCQMLTSVDGAPAKQCVPRSNNCMVIMPPTCTDDAREPNDTIDQAATQPSLDTGTVYGETSCPDGAGGTNPDWYRIDVTEDNDLTINLTGGSASDLDLVLTDDHGNLYGASTGTTSTESIERCLGAGTYYVKVYSSS